MNNRYAACAVLLALAACSGPRLKVGQTQEGEVVEAEGLVPYRAEDLPGTQAAGLAAAQRSAVERVVGVIVSAHTRVDKAVAIEQNILARTSGYVKKYDVLSERKEGGYWKTRIRALVSFDSVASDLKSFGILDAKRAGDPRVAVLVDETVDGQPAETTHAGDALAAALLESGYVVVDRASMAGAAMQRMIDAVERGDVKAAGDLGSRIKAEVVVMGEGSASRLKDLDPRLGGFASYRARISAKAVRSGSGQVLASALRQASGMDVDPQAASAKALAAAARLLAEYLAPQMAETLSSRSEVSLEVSGLRDVNELAALQQALRAGGLGEARLRSYSAGTAELSLSGTGAEEAASKLARIKSPALKVGEVGASGLSAEIAR